MRKEASSGIVLATMLCEFRIDVSCNETNTNKASNYNSGMMFVAAAPKELVLAEQETLRGGLN